MKILAVPTPGLCRNNPPDELVGVQWTLSPLLRAKAVDNRLSGMKRSSRIVRFRF
jgi:hypothetical protein